MVAVVLLDMVMGVMKMLVQSALIAIVGLGWLGSAGVGLLLLLGRNHRLSRMALHLTSTAIRTSTEVEFLDMHGVLVQICDILAYIVARA